jgi:aminoglycoside phosphotransferase (APT) family kinase protein
VTSQVSLDACLPQHLRAPSTAFARISRGLSGAGVYRVEAGGQTYVLKIAPEPEPLDAWRRRLGLQRLVAEAGLAPRVVHHDEMRRAVVSEHVADRGFMARLADPRTRAAAIDQLGHTLRRVHALPLPDGAAWQDPRDMFAPAWAGLADFALPTFARAAIEHLRAETPPPRERPLVLSHNDPNPSNFVLDGERLLLLDWDAAGPNDPFYDLAAVALFLRMDDATVARLIAAHDAAPPAAVPEGFRYARRLVAAACATMAFQLARRAGHRGGDLRADDAPTLLGVHASMSAGTLTLSTPEGLWAFALALVRSAS